MPRPPAWRCSSGASSVGEGSVAWIEGTAVVLDRRGDMAVCHHERHHNLMLRAVVEPVTDDVGDDLVERERQAEGDIGRQAGLGAEGVDAIDQAADLRPMCCAA